MQIYSLTGITNHSKYRDAADYIVQALFAHTIAVQRAYAQ